MIVRALRIVRRGRNLIGLSFLLVFTAAATVAQAQSAAPAVSSISLISSPASGDTYALGEAVEVSVRLDRAVTATGEPQVALTVGTQTRHATFYGWGRESLHFSYTVQEADRDEDGISITANAVLLSGGTIKAADGTTDADLTHEAIAAQRGSKVNGSLIGPPPRVKDVSFISSPARGDAYGLGEMVEVVVEFDRAVTATGSPQVGLTIGTHTRHATFSAWSRQSLYFGYTVQTEDVDEDGISIAANAFFLNGGTIKAAASTIDADLTHEALTAQRGSKVNGSLNTQPGVRRVALISSPAGGDTYGLGETVEVLVEFDRAVTATGSPQVALIIGTQTRHATFSAWAGEALYFSYTVQREDVDEDGISIAANALVLGGGTIKAGVGATAVDLTHRAVAAERRSKVNGSLSAPPGVRGMAIISSPAKGDTYEAGETIEVLVEFNRAVTVTGSPQVALTVGTETRHATLSGWGSHSLFFYYTVQEVDRDEDGIAIGANALLLNGATIRTADGTIDADLTHGELAAHRRSKVSGSGVNRESTPPAVKQVAFISSPARGDTYELGETVEVVVGFTGPVTATGTPLVALTIGTHTRHATLSGWGSHSLFFYYTVQEVDRDEDGIAIGANALLLNGGTIRSADGTTDANLTNEAIAAQRDSKVDGSRVTPPAVRDIGFTSFPARGDTYELGETIEVRVQFDAAVSVTGWPHVALSIGTQTRHAGLSGWGSHSLYFDYTVQEADRDEDGVSIAANALLLSGGTITNADGTAHADLTHEAVAETDGKVNGSLIAPPKVWGIAFDSSPALGTTYELGETIEVRVEFDRAVQVTGSPQVALTIGTETRQAAYALSWWDPRYAHFSYAVQEEDRDEDGISIAANALALNGGTITHADDPTTGASIAHSGVAADFTRKVNGRLVTQPMVRAIYLDNHVPPPTGDTYVRGERVRVWVEFDRDVTVTGRPLVALTIGSETRHATYSGHSVIAVPGGGTVVDADVLSFDYLVQATDRDEDGISIAANTLALNGGSVRHAAKLTVDADLGHAAVAADPGRKVNGSRAEP